MGNIHQVEVVVHVDHLKGCDMNDAPGYAGPVCLSDDATGILQGNSAA